MLNKIWSTRSTFIETLVKEMFRPLPGMGDHEKLHFLHDRSSRDEQKREGCTTFAIHTRIYVTGSAAGSTSSLRDVIIRRAIEVRVRWRGRKLLGVRARARLHELVVVITESRGGLLSIAFVYRSIGRSPSRRPRDEPVRAGERRGVARKRGVSIIISNYVTFCTVIRTPLSGAASVERITG